MRLWVVRHGKAEQSSLTGRDEDRPLLKRGESQARWLGEQIAGKKRRPGLILASGLLRARHTAQIIHEHVGGTLETVRDLETGKSVSEAVALISSRINEGGLMLVGHNPTLGELVWVLERGLPPHEAMMRTGEAVVFDFDGGFEVGRGLLHKRLRLDGD